MKRILCFLLSAVSLVALMIGAVGCKDSESGECVYEITAEYVPETATLTAMMKVEYKNTTANEISELKFNLYPNAYREDAAYQPVSAVYSSSAYYAGKSYGSMEISSVDGAKNWEIKGEDENILSVSLEESLFPGDKVNLNICFLTSLQKSITAPVWDKNQSISEISSPFSALIPTTVFMSAFTIPTAIPSFPNALRIK